jgi:pimeloyl-ACP methyl ester carboxylesterase
VHRKYFDINGVAIFTHHTGPTTLPGEPPAVGPGRTLVCLHGAGSNGHVFAGLLETLGSEHRVVAFDQPGHGRSGQLDSLGEIGRMASFTLAFLDTLDLGPIVLLGHDMGAAVAMQCALDRPDCAEALILCSAGDRFALGKDTLDLARRVSEGKQRRPFDATAFSKKTPADIMKSAFMEGMKTDPRASYGDLLACEAWDDTAQLESLSLPALILHGEDEKETVREAARSLESRLPAAVLRELPEAGHMLPMEASEAFAGAVGRYLKGLDQ